MYGEADLHQIWTTEEKFIMAGCISSAKIVYQICVCSGQVKGLLRYYCLHRLLASWQGWSTAISRSQLVGTTLYSEILILLWFCPELLVVSSQASSIVLWSQTALWDQELEQISTWNMVSRKGMQEHIGRIHDATEQKGHNLHIIKKWIHAGKNTWLWTTTIHWY